MYLQICSCIGYDISKYVNMYHSLQICYVYDDNLKSNHFIFTFHAVKEFLEKCKTEFEEKWNHPKHVSSFYY